MLSPIPWGVGMGNGQTSNVVRFGVFEADVRTGELRKAGLRIRLQEQPFRILAALLERPGELVTRDELRQRIWPKESFGDFDHAIDLAVGKLRTALGDSAGVPRFVETLPRRGYRFLASTSTEALSETAHPESVPTDLTPARTQWGKSITAWRVGAAIAVALLPFLQRIS
jgi:DNA-binding winged helix-turn-helix (wHTH) protein